MTWKFFGEWLGKKFPTKRCPFITTKTWDQLCDNDKKLLLKDDNEANVLSLSVMFWILIIFIIVFTLNWVLA